MEAWRLKRSRGGSVDQCPMFAGLHQFDDVQDLDPHQSDKSDPDSHQSDDSDPGPNQIGKRDPDLHQGDADP